MALFKRGRRLEDAEDAELERQFARLCLYVPKASLKIKRQGQHWLGLFPRPLHSLELEVQFREGYRKAEFNAFPSAEAYCAMAAEQEKQRC